jgi:hypothetical protein
MKFINLLKKNDSLFYLIKNIQRILKKILKKLFIFSGLDERISKLEKSLIYEYDEKEFDWNNNSLNGQKYRKQIITEILANNKFDVIVETGTEYGLTTKFFSQFSDKIISIEKSIPIYTIAKKNLANQKNIKLVHNDSKDLDKILVKNGINLNTQNKIFFYLDAHSDDDYPLVDEIKYIFQNYKSFILLIDDFQVPNDNGYGYDSYLGKKLNINFIKKLFTNKEHIFFPNIPSIKETGRLRGYVIITNDEEFKKFLIKIDELDYYSV